MIKSIIIFFIYSSLWCSVVINRIIDMTVIVGNSVVYCISFTNPTGIPVMYCLLEVVSVCPEKLAHRFIEKIDWIKVSISFVFYLDVG